MGELAQSDIAECVAKAVAYYRADGARVIAALRMRNGKHGEIRVLPSGEIEVGIASIPGREIPALEKLGHNAQKLADDDCLNVTIATYLIQRDIVLGGQRGGGSSPKDADAALQSLARQMGSVPTQSRVMPDKCVVAAAARYALPVPLFQAVLKTEGGWVGLKKRNSNGSYDLGPGQINTIHLPELRKFGITEGALVNDPCTNLHVAAYRLRFEINRAGELWRGIGNYHSRTQHLNQAYQGRVRANLAKIVASNP